MSTLLRSCLYRSVDDEGHVAADFLEFMRQRGLFVPSGDGAWPDRPSYGRHPLDVLIDLEVNWNVHLWFKVRLLHAAVSGKRMKVVIAPSRAVLEPQIQSTSVAKTRTLAATRAIIHQRLRVYLAILGASTAPPQYPGVWVDAYESSVAWMTEAVKARSELVRPPNGTYSFLQKQTESKRVDSIAVLAAISWWFLELYINVVSPRALAAVLKARSVSLASFEKELTLERLCVVQFHQAYAAAVTAVLANYYFRSQICRRNMVALLDDVRRLVAQASAQTSATDVAHQWRSAGIRIWPRLAALRAAQRLMLEHEGAAAMVMPNALDNGER
ncbi:hypothetical protein V5799_008311 [Amblyomma americanum]|uniref:Uncharacterized protein n=1 Tax=Amblyomma americanum TaxID=6943 RepID=A0AAQ4FEF8_AMBAM